MVPFWIMHRFLFSTLTTLCFVAFVGQARAGELIEQNVVSVEATQSTTRELHPWSRAPIVPAVFTVSRSGPTGHSLYVAYRVGGTAENGVDYELLSSEVIIPEGESSVQIYVTVIDDLIYEPTETVEIELLPIPCIAIYPPPPDCYAVGPNDHAEAVILDNDNAPPTIAITSPGQGNTSSEPAEILFAVNTVDPDGWVQLVEFYANAQKIGEQAIYFFVAPPPGQEQVFEFTWSDVPAGLYLLSARATDQLGAKSWSEPVIIWVRENPGVPVVNIFAIDPFAREEATPHGVNTARFKVRRDGGDLGAPLEVSYELHGTATNGEDYEILPGVITIPAGLHCASIPVVPIDDEEPEGRETVVPALFQPLDVEPPPYRVGWHGRAGAVIVDRDYAPPFCAALGDGRIHICRVAEAGDAFQLEVTEDMETWTPVETLTADEGGLHYVDTTSDESSTKCYRFVPVPVDVMAIDD